MRTLSFAAATFAFLTLSTASGAYAFTPRTLGLEHLVTVGTEKPTMTVAIRYSHQRLLEKFDASGPIEVHVRYESKALAAPIAVSARVDPFSDQVRERRHRR